MRQLTVREKQFCRFYVLLRDPGQAAEWAGYPPRESRSAAEKLLGKKEITNYLMECAGDLQESHPEQILLSVALRLANGPVNDAVLLLRHDELSEQQLKALNLFSVSEIRQGKDGAVEIKFYDRLKALELLRGIVRDASQKEGADGLYAALERGAAGRTADGAV